MLIVKCALTLFFLLIIKFRVIFEDIYKIYNSPLFFPKLNKILLIEFLLIKKTTPLIKI